MDNFLTEKSMYKSIGFLYTVLAKMYRTLNVNKHISQV